MNSKDKDFDPTTYTPTPEQEESIRRYKAANKLLTDAVLMEEAERKRLKLEGRKRVSKK